MAFILKSSAAPLVWPVSIHVAQDGGDTEEQVVNLHFRQMKRSEYNALAAELAIKASKITNGQFFEEDTERAADDVSIAAAIVVGWDTAGANALLYEDGSPVPFTSDNKEAFINAPGVAMCIVKAYNTATNGEAKAKNSARPRDIGSAR